jgi:predicted secreted protein
MVDHVKMLGLGMVLTILAMCMGISQVNIADGCREDSIQEAISEAQYEDTIKAISITKNKNLTYNQTSALRGIIFKPEEGYVIDGKQLEAKNSIRAELNEPFNITLDSNPTTGYSWTVDFDHKFLSNGTESYSTISSSRLELIGSAGQQIFTFTPIQEGQTIITAAYKRPWENTAADERMFLIIILPPDNT